MERAVHFSKSFIIAMALSRGHLSVEEASQAALVEVQSQIDRWGEVEDSESASYGLVCFGPNAPSISSAHDVDYRDIRRQLSSAALVFSKV